MGLPFIIEIINILSLRLLNIEITPLALSKFRNYQINLYSGGYPKVNWKNWIDLLLDYPLVFLQFLIAPIPVIAIRKIPGIAYLMDGLFVTGLILIISSKIKKYYNNLWIVLSFIFMSLSSMYEFVITGAVRHRYIGIILILPVISEILTKQGKQNFTIRRKGKNDDRNFDVNYESTKY